MVAENLLRDRLGKVERGLPVAEMKKLKYEDIRKILILDYRTRGVKMLETDEQIVFAVAFDFRLAALTALDFVAKFLSGSSRSG